MPNPHGSFIWYELLTPDADGAKQFYDSVVGWNVHASSSFPNGYRMIERSAGKFAGGLLPLTDEMKGHGARPGWLGYVGVDDVDATVAAATADGARAIMPPFDIPGIGRVALLADPQGAPIYVMRGASDQDSDAFSVEQPGHMRWNELSTTDQDSAVAFYGKLFGWTQQGAMPMGEMGDYKFIEADGTMIGAIMPKMPQTPASAWNYYIGVDDIDRAAGAVRGGGGQILQEPIEIPGGEYSLVGVDPQGANFGLVGPRKS
jgi:predicted enzyme related to lactoylglutathione lyase